MLEKFLFSLIFADYRYSFFTPLYFGVDVVVCCCRKTMLYFYLHVFIFLPHADDVTLTWTNLLTVHEN